MIPLADYYRQVGAPANNGLCAPGREYPGFADNVDYSVSPGQALWLPLQTGDLLSLCAGDSLRVAAVGLANGKDAIAALVGDAGDAPPTQAASPPDYDRRPIEARLQGMGLQYEQLAFYGLPATPQGEAAVWKIQAPLILILVLPESRENMVGGGNKAAAELRHRPAATTTPRLPPPLGKTLDEFTVQRGTARAYELPKSAYVQIIDAQGRQCSDFTAFNARALGEGRERHIDSAVSRTFAGGAYPRPGLFNKFYDGDIEPLLELTQDTIGRHDTFALACTARGYEERGFPGHVNCSDNISAALARFGVGARRAWPAINFFFNSWILPSDNRLESDEAWSRAGDYVLLRALADLVAVSTACPDDIDPINGWNPTDIHVRIYAPAANIKPAVAYRLTPNEPANMTSESPFHSRTSKLTSQYAAHLDYWTPQHYEQTGALAEYWACRERAVMQDMSNLRIYDICGADAQAFLQRVLTRDVRRVARNKGVYALICDESGALLDDGTLFNIGENIYRWTCSSGESLLHLKREAQESGAHVFIRDMSKTLCALAIQGPLSGEILKELLFIAPTQPAFDRIGWFGGAVARLRNREGAPLYASRTGYTGELGYELFCDNRDAPALWDAVAAAGGERIAPMGAEALAILRVEAGFAARGNEFGDMQDPYEAGLGFAVDDDKPNFVGKAALARNRAAQRRRLVGLLLEGNETARAGDGVYCGRNLAGRATSAVYSPLLQKSVAMAIVNVEHAELGAALAIGKLDGHAKRLPAKVCALPFVDAKRKRPRGL